MKNVFRLKRPVAMLLALVMIFSLLPVHAHAAESGRESDTIFFATDLHAESSTLKSLLQALQYTPGLVVLGGDHVNNTDSGSLASITSTIHSVYSGVQTFYTYAAHDTNVSADSSNPYAYANTGEYYEGEDYYVYGVDQNDMQSASNASTASANFKTWADTIDSSKVIFVVCHMPIHSRRGDNAGGATWMTALNEVGKSHDIVYLWGHNHTGENSTDTSVYFVSVGGSLTPQGGSTGTINFTYMNAGYIKNGYASMVVVNDDVVNVTRYSTSGSATANYTIQRRFAETHTWEVTEYVAATCDTDGYETKVCADCGETKTSVIAATGHNYSSVVQDTCTGSYTVYTCTACGHSYSEANPTETTYDSASSLVEGESYVIVASNYALTYGSSVGKTSVTVSNGSITSDVTDAMIWTYTGGKLYNEANGMYINASSSRISFGSSGASVSYSSNKLKLGNYYLRYSSSSFSASRTSGSTVYLYQVNEAVGGTGEHVYETTTVEPTCVSDGSVTYTCTACGYSYSEVIAANGNHSYETVVTAPTCTEQGYTTYTCACGDSYVSDKVAALGHNYESVTVEATCTKDGSVVYTCACGDSYSEVIPATGHSYKTVVTAPTCTEQGYTTYTCACGDSYVSDKVAALGHDYESVTVAPTCTEGGYTGNTCVNCGDTTVTDETAALGHSYEAVVTEATCTTAGYTTYTCHCADSYVADEVAALGHNNKSVVTEATCETAGYTTHTCTLCGEVTVDSYVAALGHDYETVTVNATCTEAGSETSTCVRCGDSSTQVIPALGHSYEAVVTAPTCEIAGYTTYTCACGDSYVSDEVAALGHDYETVTVAATCTEAGSVTSTCRCGDSYSEVIPATGHSHEAVVTAPTCETEGYTTYTCACGDSYVADQVAALGHSYETETLEATCETDGSVTETCVNCGNSHVEVIPATGHDYESYTVTLTCTEDGFTKYTCTNCSHSYYENYVEAAGHDYEVTVENGYNVYTCTVCGDHYSDEVVITYNRVNNITAGNTYVITVYSSGKYYALTHANNTLSVVQVSTENSWISSEVTEDMLWTYENNKLSYEDNGTVYYLYCPGSNRTMTVSTTRYSNVSFSSSKLKVGNYYLRYNFGRVIGYRSGTTTYFFQES